VTNEYDVSQQLRVEAYTSTILPEAVGGPIGASRWQRYVESLMGPTMPRVESPKVVVYDGFEPPRNEKAC
jgi:hypothetical protein